jgi:hypothetical protein
MQSHSTNSQLGMITSVEQLQQLPIEKIHEIIVNLQAQAAYANREAHQATTLLGTTEEQRLYECALKHVAKDALITCIGSIEQVEKILRDLRPTALQLYRSWLQEINTQPETIIEG